LICSLYHLQLPTGVFFELRLRAVRLISSFMPQIVLSAYEATAGFPSDDGDDGDYGLMWPSIDDFCEVPPRSQRRQGSGTQQPHLVLNIPQGLNPLYNPLYNQVFQPFGRPTFD